MRKNWKHQRLNYSKSRLEGDCRWLGGICTIAMISCNSWAPETPFFPLKCLGTAGYERIKLEVSGTLPSHAWAKATRNHKNIQNPTVRSLKSPQSCQWRKGSTWIPKKNQCGYTCFNSAQFARLPKTQKVINVWRNESSNPQLMALC